MKKSIGIAESFWLLGIVFCVFIVSCIVYRCSSEQLTITVDRRERIVAGSGNAISSRYLVWSSEGEVFEVTDSVSFLTWDSSDRYGQLHEGVSFTVTVAGWRVPWLSWYRNIVLLEKAK